ncbi:MAG: [FeFe] hydrogenase H-cluster radical SAM maturase HydE [Bacteroidales bacterium]
MKTEVDHILSKKILTKEDIVYFLSTKEEREKHRIFRKAHETKKTFVGNHVFLRGLIEVSNICRKDCFYCGIRKSNDHVKRYTLSEDEIVEKALWAWRRNYGSVVIQSGERADKVFTDLIASSLRKIREMTDGKLGVTLSCGEQDLEVYRQWRETGAHRYLLRIETSSEELFRKIHPDNEFHRFEERLRALQNLQKAGFQTGTGVMIGLPGQTIESLANDLLFMRDFDIDMIGMGPYIPHQDTPMGKGMESLLPPAERFDLSLRMIALARIMMKDINIAASTAMQVLDPDGRIKAILAGANVFMPNMTPKFYADSYYLYEGKPAVANDPMIIVKELETRLKALGHQIGYGKWGDPKHYFKRIV